MSWEADLSKRECEASGCNCGQDECLPARQFNREVEIHKARAAAIAKYHRDFNTALEGYLGALWRVS